MKTWEIRKMIDENPDKMIGKNFKLTKGILNYYEVISVGEIAKVTEFNSLTDLSRNWWRIGDLTGFEEWEEVKEPVGFMTAFKAFREGKAISVEDGELTGGRFTYYPRTNERYVAFSEEDIANGKWYIE